ncbi:FBP domain-containing protein [Nocardiopsis sp. EMB25]|uniref:FBP domain-containing protein n=1 Tax=Nocardiopsis TaxID=2013 RepID=UPI00047650A6|nr:MULTISPECIES: FBP domain-containing protein [Nocardiopsis]MCY9786112.1 FBP domain-containing protein [Nocardiopsis sp. EMB25]
MKALTERDIRGSFINCSKGEAQRLSPPRDLAERPWEHLDFLGWRDHTAHERAYLVVEGEEGPVGVALRIVPARDGFRPTLCSLCLTTHRGGGVTLMSAPKAGKAGREGNTVGLRMCADFACSLYIRGLREPGPGGGRIVESLTVEEQAARARENLGGFLERLRA